MPTIEEDIYQWGLRKGDRRKIHDYADKTLKGVLDVVERRKKKTQEAIDGNTRAAVQIRDYLADNGQPLISWYHKGRRLV